MDHRCLAGRAIQHIEYLPFGEELLNQRATSYSERYTFTGKELDEESNLYYYDARYNSSTYSQFNSVDPMSDKYPSVNPYLYCAGNPIKFVDPTGEVIAIEEGDKTYTFGEKDGNYGFYCGKECLNSDFANKVTDALKKIGEGHWGSIIINALNVNEKTVLIQYEKGRNHFDNRSIIVFWDPALEDGGLDVNLKTNHPSFISLIHEMAHATSEMYGFFDNSIWLKCFDVNDNRKDILNEEKWATFVENLVREEHGVPYRKYYAYVETLFGKCGVGRVYNTRGKNKGYRYPMYKEMNKLYRSY